MVAVVEEIEGKVVLPERVGHGLDSDPAPENRAEVVGATLRHRTQGVNEAPGAINRDLLDPPLPDCVRADDVTVAVKQDDIRVSRKCDRPHRDKPCVLAHVQAGDSLPGRPSDPASVPPRHPGSLLLIRRGNRVSSIDS